MTYRKIQILAISCSVALGVVLMGAGSASAAQLSGGLKAGTQHQSGKFDLVTKTRGRKGRRHGNRHRNRHGNRYRHGNRHRNNFWFGVGAGALLGSALSAPYYNDNTYYAPRRYYAPRPVALAPWSDGWYQYCSRKFRSFNPRTGYYRSYSRGNVFCVAKVSGYQGNYRAPQTAYRYNQPVAVKSWKECALDSMERSPIVELNDC